MWSTKGAMSLDARLNPLSAVKVRHLHTVPSTKRKACWMWGNQRRNDTGFTTRPGAVKDTMKAAVFPASKCLRNLGNEKWILDLVGKHSWNVENIHTRRSWLFYSVSIHRLFTQINNILYTRADTCVHTQLPVYVSTEYEFEDLFSTQKNVIGKTLR